MFGIARIDDINLRAAIAVTVLAPRRVAAQVVDIFRRRRDHSGKIDGVFGLETRAAIRRYQFEIKAELSGRLTAEQATQLINGIR